MGPGRHQEALEWVIIQTEEVFLAEKMWGNWRAESDRNWLVAARMETDDMDQHPMTYLR